MRPNPPGPNRGAQFRAAARHSVRVRRLRLFIIAGCGLAITALIGRAFFDPFSKVPGNLSIARSALNGTRVTMELPKLSGFRADGRPYDVRATSGVQDIRTPNIIELTDLDAKFETTTKTEIHVAAPRGIYDSAKDFMKLENDIRITSDSGYDIRMHNADVDFKAGEIVSREPVTVVMNGGTINADALVVKENGGRITFEGNVHTLLQNTADSADTGGQAQ
jgi:lipopolysaccharide export system protein LptC